MRAQISEELDRVLKKKGGNLRSVVLKKIEKIKKFPEAGKPLSYDLTGFRSERVGVFRLIYRIEGDLIKFHTLEHRKKVYR